MSKLFEPLTLRGVTLPNRTMISPMCMYSAQEGFADDFHLVHLGRFALGGFGLVMVESAAVENRGRITYGDVGIWSDDHIAPLKKVAGFLKANGSVPAIQLGHSGWKGSMQRPWEGDGKLTDEQFAKGETPWDIVGVGAEPFIDGWLNPHQLTPEELLQVTESYRAATRRAFEAGFEVVEMHAAHGYLLSSFLSPLSNKRKDEYGGDRQRRFRFPLEVAKTIRDEWPAHLPMFVRVSAVDYVPGGVEIEDTVEFAKQIKELGVDLVDCSSAGVSPHGRPPRAFGFQVPFADRVKHEAGLPTAAVGLITKPEQAEHILAEGKADLIAIAREALINPNWALSARAALSPTQNADFDEWPTQYKVWLVNRQRVLREIELA